MNRKSWWLYGAGFTLVTAFLTGNWWWLLPAGIMTAAGVGVLIPRPRGGRHRRPLKIRPVRHLHRDDPDAVVRSENGVTTISRRQS